MLATVLPDVDIEALTEQLASRRRFVWVRRNLTPRQRQAVYALGVMAAEDELPAVLRKHEREDAVHENVAVVQ